MKKESIRVICGLLLLSLFVVTAPALAKGLKKQRIVGNPAIDGKAIPVLRYYGEGLYAALRPKNGRFNDANSAWIAGEKGVLIIDPPSDRRTTNLWLNRSEDQDLTIRYIINTHWHGDHTEGNHRLQQEIENELRIIGHKTLTEDIPERTTTKHQQDVAKWREQVPLAKQALAEGKGLQGQDLTEAQQRTFASGIKRTDEWLEQHGDAVFLPPTETYSDHLTLDLGGVELDLYHFKAHTRGDTVILLKDQRIAFSGDVLDEIPYVGHGYPRAWLKALDVMAGWDVTLFIPGHGNPVAPSHIDKVRGYLAELIRQVDAAREAGQTLEQTKSSIDLSGWRTKFVSDPPSTRFFDQSLNDAVDAAWREAEGN